MSEPHPSPASLPQAIEGTSESDGGPHRATAPKGGDDAAVPTAAEPLSLYRALEASDRFHRDSRVGGIFHHGKISFRDRSPTDSLHVILDGDRVSVHIDDVSPLRCRPDGSFRYSWSRVLAHNVAGSVADLGRRLKGMQGHQRCNLKCQAVWVDDKLADNVVPALLDELRLDAARPKEPIRPGPLRVPFGLIDEAILLLDTDAAPWSIQLEIRVAGALDEARLRQALTRAMALHPMARARKEASPRFRQHDHWVIPAVADVDPLRVVDCVNDDDLTAARAELQSVGVPLAESPPFRARLARHPDGDVLMLSVNHAAMDAFAALRVLQSVARAYTGTPDPPSTLDPIEARGLPVRLASAADVTTRLRRYLALVEKLRDLVVPPARLAADGASQEAGYGFHHVALTVAETEALVRLGHDGTTDDVLLAALHLAIAGWNAEHGKRCGRIGVLVPANLRPDQWAGDVVGNFSLPARTSTTAASRRTPRSALSSLTAQTRGQNRTGAGMAVLEVLGRSDALPVWAKRVMVMLLPLTDYRLVDSALLSDLGQLSDPPDFGAEAGGTVEMWFSPPARMPTGLAIGTVTASGRLHLAVRYRRRLFDAPAAGRFADRYLSELDQVIATLKASQPTPQ